MIRRIEGKITEISIEPLFTSFCQLWSILLTIIRKRTLVQDDKKGLNDNQNCGECS